MVKTRFAPSPTGYLHIGGARTALFCWLYARRLGGCFVLRVEDTDLERSTPASKQAILEAMDWLGLDYDEGPFYQTERFERYREVAEQLLDEGKAYYCYATREELDALRTEQMARKEKPRYDGRYRNHQGPPREGVNPVIRFKNPLDGEVVIDDLVKGQIIINNRELDDLIIVRADGSPTYNFCVVVDDMDMEISHVIRGDDHVNNTPRQINILRALGAELPAYAHVPMILGADAKRLSKRHGAVSVMQYRDDGILPDALLNYLVRLGWSHGDQEVFSRQEMIELFRLEDVNRAASIFNTEKLLWLNQQYLKSTDPATLAPLLAERLRALGLDPDAGPPLARVVEVYRERAQTLVEMATACPYLFVELEGFDPAAAGKHLTAEAGEVLARLRELLESVEDWRAPVLDGVNKQVLKELGIKMPKLGLPLRVALTGNTQSPAIDQTLELVGRERALRRLDRALALIGGNGA